jgi:hypothetical protein
MEDKPVPFKAFVITEQQLERLRQSVKAMGEQAYAISQQAFAWEIYLGKGLIETFCPPDSSARCVPPPTPR